MTARRERFGAVDWALCAVLAVALVVAVGASVQRVATMTWQEWNDGRLAASAALAYGYELYSPEGEGLMLGHVYGPVSAAYYLPAVLIASTPAAAVWVGSVMSFLIFMAPVLFLLAVGGRHPSARSELAGWLPVAMGLVVFWLFVFQQQMFLGPAFNIHADAPALGFGLLACAFTLIGRDPLRRWAYLAAAVAAVLSVGSKQVMVLLPVVLILFVGLAHGRRALGRFMAALFVAGVVILAAVALWVDFGAMIFNAVVLPSRHPWVGDSRLGQLVQAFRDLAPRMLPAALVVGFVGLAELFGRRLRLDNWRHWSADNGWSLLILLGLLNIPLALMGRAKVGGSMNTLSFSGYFLCIGATMALVQAARRDDVAFLLPLRTWGRAALAGFLILLSVAAWPLLSPEMSFTERVAANPESAAYEFALAHPGQVYFPFHPLITMMAEGAAYHFSDAVYARELGDYVVEQAQFDASMPPALTYVATNRAYEDYSLRYLPGFRRRVDLAELPGWVVLVRGTDGPR